MFEAFSHCWREVTDGRLWIMQHKREITPCANGCLKSPDKQKDIIETHSRSFEGRARSCTSRLDMSFEVLNE